MGQTTDQIANHIASRREDLHSNLQELETKVKSASDWRHHFRKHPGLAVAAAFGGGMLLSGLLGKPRVRAPVASPTPSDAAHPSDGAHSQMSGISRQALDAWDGIKGALLGVAATRIKDMLSDAVPGFSEHLAKGNPGNDSADRASAARHEVPIAARLPASSHIAKEPSAPTRW